MKKLMINLLLGFSLLISSAYAAGPIGTLGFVDNYTFTPKQVNLAPVGSVFQLYGYIASGGQHANFRLPGGTVTGGYLVTSSVKVQGLLVPTSAGGSSSFTIGYSDTDVGIASASTPSNPKYLAGTASMQLFTTNSGDSKAPVPLDFVVPSGKYLYLEGGGSANAPVILFCTGQ